MAEGKIVDAGHLPTGHYVNFEFLAENISDTQTCKFSNDFVAPCSVAVSLWKFVVKFLSYKGEIKITVTLSRMDTTGDYLSGVVQVSNIEAEGWKFSNFEQEFSQELMAPGDEMFRPVTLAHPEDPVNWTGNYPKIKLNISLQVRGCHVVSKENVRDPRSEVQKHSRRWLN